MSVIVGKCKNEISRIMPPFKGMPDWLAEEMKKEYKTEIGDIVRFENNESGGYYFYLNHERIDMSRTELEEHFEIVWEYGCYNTCIRDGIPCNKIGQYIPEGTTDRSKYWSNCCRIGWEVGRAACYMYEVEEAQ
ncbi:hypothetical protein [Paenibacillus oleatilyticus]|uniref:hypothetical protein n=1 Tax=Paenibacillus oleatilyticus TaxID=2594886 RepID=UPI001C1FD493|nr:hypothetical protein [Paenibacillus oleatilyticus]MBU7316088.1 hypothetical protein [Paenibacillus oleatilyticus]